MGIGGNWTVRGIIIFFIDLTSPRMYYIVSTMSFKIWIIIMKFVRVIIIYLLI